MEKFEQIIQEGYKFNMDHYMSRGWDHFRKDAGSLIGYALIVIIVSMVIAFIPFIGLANMFLQSTFLAGIYLFLRQQNRKQQNFNQLFDGFSYFGPIAVYLVIQFLFFIPLFVLLFTVIIPFDIFTGMFTGDMDPQYIAEEIAMSLEGNIGMLLIGYLVFFIGAMYIYISYQFTLPLIVDAKLGFWEAMETSRRVIGRKFFMFFILFLIIGILAALGTVMTCGLGMFVALPYVHCVIFAAYDDILKPQDEDLSNQISEFGEKEKDVNTEAEDDSNL